MIGIKIRAREKIMPPTYSATAQVTLEMLYCYTNSTHKMQLIRVLTNDSCNYEKVVFPQQRIFLSAIPEGWLEVYIERDGKQVLEKMFSCQDLPANQPQQELATVESF